MINVHRKLCMAIVPTAIIGVFLVAVLMHFLTKYALDSILKDTPEHVQIVNLALYRIDVFTIVLAIIATAIFIWITIIRFKKLAEADIGKYLQAMDSARSPIIMTDAEGAIIYANKGAEDITGYTFEEMRGNTSRLWGGLMPREFYKDLWRTVKTELKPFRAEVKNRRKNQDEYYALVCITPILNKAKRLTGFVATEQDITKLKELDIAKSEFISLASHQLRTPIAGLNWLIEAIQFNSANLTPKQKEYLNNLSGQSKRMIELVEDLLNISRIELKSPAMADRRIIKIGEFADKFIKSMTSYATLNKHTMSLEDKVGASVAVEANERALNIEIGR